MANYIVSGNELISPGTILLTLAWKQGKQLQFRPGQYAAINGYKDGRPMPVRCFSIVSSPTEPEKLQFSMRVRGRFTHAVAALQPGMPVTVDGPYGGFVLDPLERPRVVLLAGGIGITPFISMMRYVTAIQSTCDIYLLFSVGKQDEIPFKDELIQLMSRNSHLRVHFCVSDGPFDLLPGGSASAGRISPEVIEAVAGAVYADVGTAFFMCGPPPFMRGMMQMLGSRGVSKSRMITEAFSQGPNRQTGKIRDWPFSMYALGALGLSAGSLAVMTSDLLKVIPAKQSVETSAQLSNKQSNQRQADLDALINGLPFNASTQGDSPSVAAATLAATPKTVATSNQASGSTKTVTPKTNTTTPSATTTPATTTTPTTPAPTTTPTSTPTPPTCKTTQSGVTKC